MAENEFSNRETGGLFVLDEAERIIQWSEGAAVLVGVPMEEALGRPCYEVVKGHDAFARQTCSSSCPGIRALKEGHWWKESSFIIDRHDQPLRLHCVLTTLPSMPGGALGCFYTKPHGRLNDTDPKIGSPLGFLKIPLGIIQDLSALSALATSLSTRSPLESLRSALEFLRETTGAEAAEVFLSDPRRRTMVLTSHCGLWPQAFFQITMFNRGEGYPGLVLDRHEPILTRALSEDPRYLRSRVKERGFRSYVCVPIFSLHNQEDVVGSLNVAFRESNTNLDRAAYLLLWVRGLLSLVLEANFVHLSRMDNTVNLDINGDLEGGLYRILSGMLKHMVSVGGAHGGILDFLNIGGKGIARRVVEGSVPPDSCPTLEDNLFGSCPVLYSGSGLALHGPRKSWPLPCRRASRLGPISYCIPLLGNEISGVARIAYQRFIPYPPTRNLVVLEETAQSAVWALQSAWTYVEGARLADTAYQQRLLRGITLSERSTPRLSPVRAKKQKGEESGLVPYLEIRCFGPFEVIRRGSLLTNNMVKRKKALELLKILITNLGRPLPKDTLMEFLWPETAPEAGANRLYVVTHALRKVIEPPGAEGRWSYIHGKDGCYYFDTESPSLIDTKEFKRLVGLGKAEEEKGNLQRAIQAYEAAVKLYKGDFLEDEPYADWCSMEREHFREVSLDTLQRLASLWAKEGAIEQTIKHLRRALRIDPVREEIHRELMRSLWAARRRDEALRQYEICKELLKRELDVHPLPETDRLALLIRNSS